MAWCYDRRRPGEDPPLEAGECSLGLVRRTDHLDGKHFSHIGSNLQIKLIVIAGSDMC
jgi:hypothetical protein